MVESSFLTWDCDTSLFYLNFGVSILSLYPCEGLGIVNLDRKCLSAYYSASSLV